MKKWKIFVIHHSHTDIGYTERQERIVRYHYEYIRQAIDILNRIHGGELNGCEGFKWQCENYWQVENFYRFASQSYQKDFEKYVHSGEIGISGNYLNLTELVDYETLDSRLHHMRDYGSSINHSIECGMSADINGFAWGYADALYDNGIRNFYSALHPHHGMFPLYQKVMPFWWETPKGNRLLVWNGEHYHFGNELFLAPYAGASYMILDDEHAAFSQHMLLQKDREDTIAQESRICQKRLERFLENLEDESYPYDFIPVLVSGALTDNAFPSEGLAQRINWMNKHLEGDIELKLSTLDDFFAHVHDACADIPVYSGDWPDWWADGVGSTPMATKTIRSAQRKASLCEKLDAGCVLGDPLRMEEARQNIMMYSEHTWGYSSSVVEPWDTLVGDLDLRKTAYAVNADVQVSKNLDEILAQKGECAIRYQRPQRFKVINPHDIRQTMKVYLYVELWEYLDGVQFWEGTQFEVYDEATSQVLDHQLTKISRAYQIEVLQDLQPHEERTLAIRAKTNGISYTVKSHPHVGADRIMDIVQPGVYEVNTHIIETDWMRIECDQQKGIVSIIDKQTGNDIIHPQAIHAPFSAVYEYTDMHGQPIDTRRKMGRNRKNEETRRYDSVLRNITLVDNGPVFASLLLDYELEGSKFYSVQLKVYKHISQIEAMVRIHKESVWDPENLYVSLPFCSGTDHGQLFIDKTGCIMRPGIDQLPGSNKEFYLLQNGMVWSDDVRTLILAIKDTPLVTLGPLASKPIRLCTAHEPEFNRQPAYCWVMNNFWETNFRVDLSGFYEFAFTLRMYDALEPRDAFACCEALNQGLLGFYI